MYVYRYHKGEEEEEEGELMKRKLMPGDSAAFYILIPSSKEASPCPELDMGNPK